MGLGEIHESFYIHTLDQVNFCVPHQQQMPGFWTLYTEWFHSCKKIMAYSWALEISLNKFKYIKWVLTVFFFFGWSEIMPNSLFSER